MKELRKLSRLLRKWNSDCDISNMSTEEICDFLILQKSISDTIEILSPIFKAEFLKREVETHINSDMGLQITSEKENNATDMDIENIFLELSIDDFLPIINVVKSKITKPIQKSVVEKHSKTILKTGRIVKVSRISKKQKVESFL